MSCAGKEHNIKVLTCKFDKSHVCAPNKDLDENPGFEAEPLLFNTKKSHSHKTNQ